MMNRILIFSVLLSLHFLSQCSSQALAKKRPNILFAIMDDATYKHMGAYGCKWVKTPNFDRVAKNGLLFQRAYTNNAKCAPSRANILTGRNSWQLEEAANHWPYFPVKFRSFAEALVEHGYRVGYTGKGFSPAVVQNADGSKRDLLVKAYNSKKKTPPTTKISPVDYAENFTEFLKEDTDLSKPFFFWFGGLEPHRGYEFGSGIAKGNKKLSDLQQEDVFKFWPDNDSVRTDLLDYAFEIEYFDHQLGKMLAKLEAIGELENTLIVVTSDNGMAFPRVKGQEYEYSNHLPLAIMWADGIQNPGRKLDNYISFIDFAPTFLELAGVEPDASKMQSVTGQSFVSLFQNETIKNGNDYVLIGKERHDVGRPHDQGYPIRGIVQNNMLYLHNFKPERWPAGNPETGYTNTDGGPTKTVILNKIKTPQEAYFWEWSFGKRPNEEFYDLSTDPDCLHNLIGDKKYLSHYKLLKEKLFSKLLEQKDPRVLGNGDIFDQYKFADPQSINFYERFFNKDKSLDWGWITDSDFQDISKFPYIQK